MRTLIHAGNDAYKLSIKQFNLSHEKQKIKKKRKAEREQKIKRQLFMIECSTEFKIH